MNPDIKSVAADIARELREDPSRWTRFQYAKDKHGYSCFSLSKEAVSWCLSGHIIKRLGGLRREQEAKFKKIAGIYELRRWNDKDGRTVEEVIELCERVARS